MPRPAKALRGRNYASPTAELLDDHANIDAVLFFAKAIWPGLRERRPDLRFFIVGSKPAPQVVELANQPGITVTGTVEDLARRPDANVAGVER